VRGAGPMNDYSKWDHIGDSDEEEEVKKRPDDFVLDEHESLLREQDEVEQWLRRQIVQLGKGEDRRQRPPELRTEEIPYRRVTKEERKVLAMLIVLSNFEEGTTNLDRHPQMLELVRHHRWLEHDYGTLELLCRVHNSAMKKASNGGGTEALEEPEEKRMRNMIMCGINTLAAPKRVGCPGGLLELITAICTPETEKAREWRKKWQKKDYAKDALFDSLFPDLRKYKDDNSEDEGSWKEMWFFCGLIVLFIVILVIVVWYLPTAGKPGAWQKVTTTLAPPPVPLAPAGDAGLERAATGEL